MGAGEAGAAQLLQRRRAALPLERLLQRAGAHAHLAGQVGDAPRPLGTLLDEDEGCPDGARHGGAVGARRCQRRAVRLRGQQARHDDLLEVARGQGAAEHAAAQLGLVAGEVHEAQPAADGRRPEVDERVEDDVGRAIRGAGRRLDRAAREVDEQLLAVGRPDHVDGQRGGGQRGVAPVRRHHPVTHLDPCLALEGHLHEVEVLEAPRGDPDLVAVAQVVHADPADVGRVVDHRETSAAFGQRELVRAERSPDLGTCLVEIGGRQPGVAGEHLHGHGHAPRARV